MSDVVRLGVIGLGNMGTAHCRDVSEVDGLKLVAVSDVASARVEEVSERHGVRGFASADALFDSGLCDAVLVATPHFAHTDLGIRALKRGLHLLVEKPISVHKADAERLIRAHAGREGQVFAAMFNQRTHPAYLEIQRLISSGELGAVRRIQWTVTDWFRSRAYYDSGGWRATWAGEGGGVLLNQCPHQLDLWQWLFGMPATVHAFCQFGRFHDIEVEDSVMACLEYADGTQGVFCTTTGEAPGSNRLEIAAEHGRLIFDAEVKALEIAWNAQPTARAIAENGPFRKPEVRRERRDMVGAGGQHRAVLENFAGAVLRGEPLIAPAQEGLHSVELANAMLLSSWRGKAVQLPMSARGYAARLQRHMANSRYRPGQESAVIGEMSDSF